MDEFEQELRQALIRRPAPLRLKQQVMESRGRRNLSRRHRNHVVWMRIAATLVIAALLGGLARWNVEREQNRKRGEEARRQVMTALRIAEHALNQMNVRLAARDRNAGE